MTTTSHSKLPPSSAARRMACPGSRAMSERYGSNTESESSVEGTLAHEFAAEYLKNGSINVTNVDVMTDEMLEGAMLYTDIVSRFIQPRNVHIEHRLDITNVHPDMWGTPDAWGFTTEAIHIFDYKFGYTPVDAFENWQLIAYACGIKQLDMADISDVYLHIIQPRDYVSSSKHKMWHITAQELETYRQRLALSESLAMSPNAELRVSAECKYCPARHACPALRNAAFGAAEVAYRDVPQGLDPQHIGNELKLLHDARDLLEYRITALEAEVQHLIQAGVNVDHYEIALSEGRMTWKVNTDEVLALGLLQGIDLRKKPDAVTPTQAIKAGMPEDEVVKYSERKQSMKLSKVDVKKAQAVFGKNRN